MQELKTVTTTSFETTRFGVELPMLRGGKSSQKDPSKINKFYLRTSFCEQSLLDSSVICLGSRQKFARTFRKMFMQMRCSLGISDFWIWGFWHLNAWFISLYQDKFDHDKGQKSAISGRRLHWRLSTGSFAFSLVFMCKLARRAPQNLEKVTKSPVEKIASNPVTSVAVMVFSALIIVC